ncbi:E3 ubiquitin-protein ligase TRIM39-like [Bufo bufo]|uniref:E3 ubiquitin-protein ligase TRIM39-like n=1 Tax=Bufo bufo TaxID=8384 RepID=UPI001ABE2D27|nr:E3 ubiquitin-protein ligase TRIM39-like [Bufo bufo]
MEIFKDPVTLPCGHSFCRDCITKTFDHQDKDDLRCPECQQRFSRRPGLNKNFRLSNIAEACTQSEQEETGIFCTFCDLPVPADKFCLQCETSMCNRHLTRHNMRTSEHTLLPPSTDLKNRKCPTHKKILEFYCMEDSACICVSCRLDGDHKGHKVEILDKAADHKKKTMKSEVEMLRSVQEVREQKIQSLQKSRTRLYKKTAVVSKRVTDQFQNLRKELGILEQKVLSEIRRQEKIMSVSSTHLIQQLETKNKELSKMIGDMEMLMRTTDPLTILQDQEFEKDDTSNGEEDTEIEEIRGPGDLQTDTNLKSLFEDVYNIVKNVENGIFRYEPTDITLDPTTAGKNLYISGDLCKAHVTDQSYPETPDSFEYPMVLSIEKFNSGNYYWEVDIGESGEWRVGVSYSSIARRGRESLIGDNDKSWCLRRYCNQIYARHDCKDVLIPNSTLDKRLGVYLDYDEGKLSFYQWTDGLRHLHTFTANFSDNLHAAFGFVARSGELSWVKIFKG